MNTAILIFITKTNLCTSTQAPHEWEVIRLGWKVTNMKIWHIAYQIIVHLQSLNHMAIKCTNSSGIIKERNNVNFKGPRT